LGVGKAIYYQPAIVSTGLEAGENKGDLIGVIQTGDLNLSLTDSYFKYL
jgi:hypothetical protein